MTELMERRRALMAAKSQALPILNPAIGYTENTRLDRTTVNPPYLVSQSGIAVTDFIYVGTTGNFVYFNPPDATIAPSGTIGSLLQYNSDNAESPFTNWWNCRMGGDERSIALDANKQFIRLNLSMEQMSGAYAYNSTTGQVYYAGKDSPYYGKTNIND